MPPIVLASASPRRRQLLAEQGYDFSVVTPNVIEVTPAHLTPRETVLFNARAKAEKIAAQHPEAVVLGVDTLVAIEGRIFGKPTDLEDALRMLQRLNGRAHEVFSGVWLTWRARQRQRGFIESTRVHFRRLGTPQLRAYLQRIAPLDKAGAYAAQEDGGELIESVEGSFTNVIGIPMEALAKALEAFVTRGEPTDCPS